MRYTCEWNISLHRGTVNIDSGLVYTSWNAPFSNPSIYFWVFPTKAVLNPRLPYFVMWSCIREVRGNTHTKPEQFWGIWVDRKPRGEPQNKVTFHCQLVGRQTHPFPWQTRSELQHVHPWDDRSLVLEQQTGVLNEHQITRGTLLSLTQP